MANAETLNLDTILANADSAALHDFEKTQIAGRVAGREFTMAQYRAIMNAVQNPVHWKQACAVWCHHSVAAIVADAITFYHGARCEISGPEAITGRVLVSSNGYACD